jgi:hypothetical protein
MSFNPSTNTLFTNNITGSGDVRFERTLTLGSNTAVGTNSHAEGKATTAQGNYSHAEGDGTTAQGLYSHAEGRDTTAEGGLFTRRRC